LYATLGALIVRRAGNTIGWYLLIAGIADGLVALASAYAVLGIRPSAFSRHCRTSRSTRKP